MLWRKWGINSIDQNNWEKCKQACFVQFPDSAPGWPDSNMLPNLACMCLTLLKDFSFIVAVHSLSHDRHFVTPWTAAHQAPLSSNVSWSLLQFMSIALVDISSSVAPFSFSLQFFPASRSFPMSQLFTSGGHSTGASAWAWILLMNIQGWFPLGLTSLISLQSWEGLSKVFSSTTIQEYQFFGAQPYSWSSFHIYT